MCVSSYLCRVVGEDPVEAKKFHASTQQRLKAFAFAIHIPVALWAATGYLIAARVFELDDRTSIGVAFCAALLIYIVERLVLSTPKSIVVNIGRVLIGLVIATLGASAVDLVVFEREVEAQLRAAGEEKIRSEFDKKIAIQIEDVAQKKADWLQAQSSANCEADGTCGSRVRSVGPVYRKLAAHANALRQDYETSSLTLKTLRQDKESEIEVWRTSPKVLRDAGLLTRIEALHSYTFAHPAALAGWGLLFSLVLALELMVVLSKMVFGETVDDQISRVREEVSQFRALSYREAITSPLAEARRLLNSDGY